MKTIIITAGGTGGHVFPALAVALELEKECNIVWVGAVRGIENDVVTKHGIPLEIIKIAGLRKKGIFALIKMPFILIKSIIHSIKLLFKYKPSAVVSFGGYASFPIAIVSCMFGVPLIIHEQNSIAGLSNKILAKCTKNILVAFKGALSDKKTILVGNPIRQNILNILDVKTRYFTRRDGLNILVLGGSLGAKFFNENLPEVFSKTQGINKIIHQVGRGNINQVKDLYQQYNVNADIINFIDNMAETYNEIDLIICRSGALTVSEICAIGLATIFIPYPYAVDNHQEYNAKPVVEVGGAKMLLQDEFTVDKMVNILNGLDRNECLNMALKAHTLGIRDSHIKIANIVKEKIK